MPFALPDYPTAEPDRPLVLYDGMTTFDASVNLPTRNDPVDLAVTHDFGGVDVFAALGEDLTVGATASTSTIPGAIGVSASFGATTDGVDVWVQRVRISHKVVLQPHRLALFAFVASELVERSGGHAVDVGGALELEAQLQTHVGLDLGAYGYTYPFSSASLDFRDFVTPFAQANLTFHHWDFYVGVALGDVTRELSATASVGLTKRWGR
jgi:hypothetical protein